VAYRAVVCALPAKTPSPANYPDCCNNYGVCASSKSPIVGKLFQLLFSLRYVRFQQKPYRWQAISVAYRAVVCAISAQAQSSASYFIYFSRCGVCATSTNPIVGKLFQFFFRAEVFAVLAKTLLSASYSNFCNNYGICVSSTNSIVGKLFQLFILLRYVRYRQRPIAYELLQLMQQLRCVH